MHHQALDRLSQGKSVVHQLDAVPKLVVTLVYTFALIATDKYEVAGLAPYVVLPAFLILLGEVPAGFLVKGVALGLPFVFLVAILNPVFDPKPVSCSFGGMTWTLRGGAVSCANIVLRFFLTASTLVALMATTPFHRIVNGLGRLRFPKMLLMVLSFLHRYLFVLVDVALRMRRARDCRAVGGKAGVGGRTLALRFRAFIGLIGVLFLRSLDQAERVYAAMLSRGFSGQLPTVSRSRMSGWDWCFLLGGVCYVALLFVHDHSWVLSGSARCSLFR